MGGSPYPSQVYQYHHPAMSPPPSASPNNVPSYVHVSGPQLVTQGNPSSTSSSFSVTPDEGSVATMLDTGHPTSAINRMVLNMTAPSFAQVLAPVPLSPAMMLPPLNDTQCFTKWLLKARAFLHAKRWNGITTQITESLAYESLSSELYMLLINCMDGDMLEPYIQGGPTSFANQDILLLHNLISMNQSSSRAGLVSVFTRFLQARMLSTETTIQYCSKIRGLSTEIGRLGQPIPKPLMRLLVVRGLTPKFSDFASQVATGVIDVVHGFNS
jgi:hypothetical protein